ncbi:MAG: hypothetical protein JSV49_08395, partial [Thermoplasmata archaeon]
MLKKYITIFIILILFFEIVTIGCKLVTSTREDVQDQQISIDVPSYKDANKILANAPKAFTENRGQLMNDDVRFYDQGGSIWFTDKGVWFSIEGRIERREGSDHGYSSKRVVLKQEFVGANSVRPQGREPLHYYSNFFYGNDSVKWRTGVPNYREVYFKNLYDGIDLRYYINENGLKYDLIVHPGADTGQIKMRYEGA